MNKRALLYIIMCLFACVYAHADNIVYIASSTVEAGNTITLAVNLRCDSPTSAFQFDLVLPEGITLATNADGQPDITKGSIVNKSRHTLDCAPMSDGSIRFICYSLNSTLFTSTNGVVAYITLKADASCSVGKKSITIRDAVFATPSAVTTYVTTPSVSTLTVKEAPLLQGDVNRDGHIDVTDVVMMVDRICHGTTSTLDLRTSDLNSDKAIDVRDVVILVDMCVSK